MNKTRILIADDHKIVRKGLAALFQTTDDLCVDGEASDGEEAVAEALMGVTAPKQHCLPSICL